MKRYLLSVLMILLATPCFAEEGWQDARMNVGVVGGGVAAAPGGPGLYYYGGGFGINDFNASSYQYANNISSGGAITCTLAGSITKIGVRLNSVSADGIKLALYYNNGGTWTLATGQTTSNSVIVNASLAVGWNDLTLSTSYACAEGETVRVMALSQTSQYINYKTGSTGYYKSSETYSSWPTGTITLSTDWCVGVSVYVE